MSTIPWPLLRRAMLPLDGSIHPLAPTMVEAFTDLVPRRTWGELTYADLTSGSCLLPLAFAAGGAGRVIVNDVAARTVLAARALFGGVTLPHDALLDLLATPARRLKKHMPSFWFASDYLLEPVAGVFDQLFHGSNSDLGRYLALRWVQGFAVAEDGDFPILFTHDPKRLAKKDDADWRAYLRRAADPVRALTPLLRDLNAVVERLADVPATIHQADLKDLAPALNWPDGPLFVAINPPTRGLDEYTVDDQLIHSLLAGRWLPLSEWHEDPRRFWESRVRKAAASLPKGAYYLVYGGDGVLSWRQCQQVWGAYGDPCHAARDGRGGWAIYRRR